MLEQVRLHLRPVGIGIATSQRKGTIHLSTLYMDVHIGIGIQCRKGRGATGGIIHLVIHKQAPFCLHFQSIKASR